MRPFQYFLNFRLFLKCILLLFEVLIEVNHVGVESLESAPSFWVYSRVLLLFDQTFGALFSLRELCNTDDAHRVFIGVLIRRKYNFFIECFGLFKSTVHFLK